MYDAFSMRGIEIAQAAHRIVGYYFSFSQNENPRADFLHHFQNVRAVENHLAFGRQRAQRGLENLCGGDREQNYCRMPLE